MEHHASYSREVGVAVHHCLRAERHGSFLELDGDEGLHDGGRCKGPARSAHALVLHRRQVLLPVIGHWKRRLEGRGVLHGQGDDSTILADTLALNLKN
jgi:hypothetical protein